MIYIINLKRDTNKRKGIEKQLEKLPGLPFEFVEAVDGKLLDHQESPYEIDYDELRRRYPYTLTNATIGCSLSHLKTYDKISKTSNKSFLILEDDAIIHPELTKEMEYLIKFLNTSSPRVVLLTPDFYYNKRNLSLTNGNYKLYRLTSGVMNSGYMLNLSAAKVLFKYLQPVRFFADEWAEMIKCGIELYGIVPHLVSYPDEFGEIGTSILKALGSQRKNKIILVLGKIKAFAFNQYLKLKGYRKSHKKWL